MNGLDSYTHYTRYKICPKTCKCIKNAIATIENKPPIYCVEHTQNGTMNCASFVVSVLQQCGFKFPQQPTDGIWETNDMLWPATKPNIKTLF